MLSSRCSRVVRLGLWSTAVTIVPSSTNANVTGTTSIAPDGFRVASRATGAAATSARLGFFGKPKNALADNVPLDLGGAAPDRLRPREEERRLHDRHGVVGTAVATAVARHVLVDVSDLAGEDLCVRTEDVQREVHRVAMRLGPEHLVSRAERGDAHVLVALHCGSERAVAVDPHDLDLRPLPREVLTDGRVVDPSVLTGALDDRVEFLFEATVARRRGRSPLETECRHRHFPTVVEPADDVVLRAPRVREEDLV